MSEIKGQVLQVIGPVVDVSFEKGVELPNIYDALYVLKSDGSRVVLEVQSHVGEPAVSRRSKDTTDGFTRGMEVMSPGESIQIRVGDQGKARLFNIVRDAIVR